MYGYIHNFHASLIHVIEMIMKFNIYSDKKLYLFPDAK